MDTVRTATDLLLFIPRLLDEVVAQSSVARARQAVLANEFRRRLRDGFEPTTGSIDLGVSELVSAGGPDHRHVRTG